MQLIKENLMKRSFVILLLLGLSGLAHADPRKLGYTQPVTEDDGDTITTSQVSVGVCPGASCPTLISSVTADGTNRRRTISNTGSYKLYIGSNTTTLSSTGYLITESSGTRTDYITWNTAPIYGVAVSTETVVLIRESNAKP